MDIVNIHNIYILQRNGVGRLKKAKIVKMINSENETRYKVYYIRENGDVDYTPEIKWTKKLAKNHIESFDNLEGAIQMIMKYGYVLSEFYNEEIYKSI